MKALLNSLRWFWGMYCNPWVIVVAYWVTIGIYFGWHWIPESDAEMQAFGFGFLMFLVAAKKFEAAK